jgi:hypothetical protein
VPYQPASYRQLDWFHRAVRPQEAQNHLRPYPVGGDIIIVGEKIKVDPISEEEPEIGVFFVDVYGTEVPLDPAAENNPQKIICRLPVVVTDGVYTLKIVTLFTGGTTLLKTLRTLQYELPLTAITR